MITDRLEYRPDQRVGAFGTFQRKNSFGIDLTQIEVGGMGRGFGSGRYQRDYLFFGALGRRLSVDANGGTDVQSQRVLGGVLTDERRKGGGGRAELELVRNRADQQVDLFAEARRESVSLTPLLGSGGRGTTASQTITTTDFGAVYQWRRTLVLHPATLRLDPSVRVGSLTDKRTRFGRLDLGGRYHQSVNGPIEAEARFQFEHASNGTPVFERPTLGGRDSVRGFRSDERVGRTLWAVQQELWLPVPAGTAKVGDFIRRNVRVAAFYDLGGVEEFPVTSEASRGPGFRHGAGAGVRVRYQGVVIETDWGYGFGNQDDARPGRGRFYFNLRLP